MIHPCVRLQLVGACQSGRVERIAQQMLATACALLTAAQCSHVLLALSLIPLAVVGFVCVAVAGKGHTPSSWAVETRENWAPCC